MPDYLHFQAAADNILLCSVMPPMNRLPDRGHKLKISEYVFLTRAVIKSWFREKQILKVEQGDIASDELIYGVGVNA